MRFDPFIKYCLLPLALVFMFAGAYGKGGHQHGDESFPASKKMAKDLHFEENKGQWDDRALFKTDLKGGRLFLEKNTLTYTFYNPADLDRIHAKRHEQNADISSEIINNHAFKVRFEGAQEQPFVHGTGQKHEYHNYFIGNDPSKWATDVKLFEKVHYTALYPFIDLDVYSHKGNLKYDLTVMPGGKASNIRMKYDGTDGLVLQDGNLVIKTSVNDIIEQKPYAYQEINGQRIRVECRFVLKKNTVSFAFPKGYDNSVPLVIDPLVVASTYSGASTDTWGHCATYDASGNIYSGGLAFGQGYPVTTGAYQTTFGGTSDAAIAKLDPQGSSFFYATYLGGSSSDYPQSLFVNANNEIYIYGSTQSTNFPTTTGAFDVTSNGGTDIFVSALNANGNGLIGSSYVGGSGFDGNNSITYNYGDAYRGEIILDTSSNVYIASVTASTNFPTTSGAYDVTQNGMQDGVVFKMNPSLTAMTWGTYIGGSQHDGTYGLRLDGIGNLYVTGTTSSSNFPSTAGTLYPAYQGGMFDGFVLYLMNNGAAVGSSTFFGTALADVSYFLDLDMNGDVYIYGVSQSSFTPSPGVYSNPGSGPFIAKLDPGLSTLTWITVFGNGSATTAYPGLNEFSPTAFMVDICGNIYASGWGDITNYPISSNAVQPTNDANDFYLLVLDQNAQSMVYATYFGDNGGWEHVDGGTSRFDKNGIVYQAVCACGGNFPTTPNAVAPTSPSWNCDIAVFKIDFQAIGVVATAVPNPSSTGCAPYTVNFDNQSSGAVDYIWDFGDGSPTDTATTPSHTYNTPGTYIITLIATDSASCNSSDTTSITVTVNATPVVNLGNDTMICGTFNLPLDAANPGATYQWSDSSSSQIINVNAGGTYWVQVSNGTCSDIDSITIMVPPPVALGSDTTLCEGELLTLNAPAEANSYLWSTGETTASIGVTASNIYWVEANTNNCITTDTISVSFHPLPMVNIGNDTTICSGAVLLDAGNAGAGYQWSTGATTQTISVAETGTYSVTVNDSGCTSSDNITITVAPPVDLGEDINVCDGTEVMLSAGDQGTAWLWSTGETTSSIEVNEDGVYWVEVSFGSCTHKDSIKVVGASTGSTVYFPNSFTPNADGLNEVFKGYGLDVEEFNMKIYNRWGELYFETNDMNMGWNGFYKGKLVQMDVYVYVVTYKTKCSAPRTIRKVGHVMVNR